MAVCWVIFRCQYIFTAIQVAHWYQGSVTSVWCHSWVLWQSKLPSCPVFMWTRGFECTRAVRSLVCVPCFVLERDARIQHYWLEFRFRWVRTLTLPFLSRCVSVRVSSSLGCALFSSRVFCVFARSSCFIGCVHSCYVLCCVAHSLWFSLAVCFHVMSYAVWHTACDFHWLCAFMLSCLVWTCGLWVLSLAACSCPVLHMACEFFVLLAMCFCFVWAHGFCLSFLCAMCSHVNCPDTAHLVSWLLVNFPRLCFPRYPPNLLRL